MEVVDYLKAGDPNTAQVVVVDILKATAGPESKPAESEIFETMTFPKGAVAKIYDPLYNDHNQDDYDPFIVVEHRYANEVAAYEMLADIQGSKIPKFYGSFSLQSATISPTANYEDEAAAKNSKPTSRVFLLDFDRAEFQRHPVFPEDHIYMSGVYVPPLLRWRITKYKASKIKHWIDWDWFPWLVSQYCYMVPLVTPEMKKFYLKPDHYRRCSDELQLSDDAENVCEVEWEFMVGEYKKYEERKNVAGG
ncbi:hypothetical protein AJ79_06549 [Helicocarpus griseus UAMH5409]|uniref:Uncharacterized protein n=1 Tax=Helicocarpus griseus UAMH5409 TaxID=1447875 RepID=A0A2B7XC37_9EURO|nr:hypothetical protein AJ79_06549 [Helicocarpus griseus UAMH5409]